jgi:hypothetical protein
MMSKRTGCIPTLAAGDEYWKEPLKEKNLNLGLFTKSVTLNETVFLIN